MENYIEKILKSEEGGFVMTRLYVRVPDDIAEKVEEKAKSKGFVKPSGEANKSAYLRKIIRDAVNDEV